MKKILPIVLLTIFISLTACTDSKWNKANPDMPEDLKAYNQQLLDENLLLMEEDPGETTYSFEAGYRYQQLGDYKNAVKYYKIVLEIDDNHYPALNNMADMYEEVEEYDLAAKHIKKLYENNPMENEVIRDTVRILLKADEPDDAQAALENFATLKKEAGDTSSQGVISDLYESILSYRQENEN